MTNDDLGADLEAALLRELRERYDWENRVRFGGTLTPPVIALSAAATRFGRWVPGERRLELSRALVVERSWTEVVGVLGHEMAHQFVDEVLGVRDETAHGATFRRVCGERGIDALAAGPPVDGRAAGGVEPDRVIGRIQKLLALAGSANRHEAEAAMRRAHELMLRHNVERIAARAAADYEVRHLGDPTRRGTRVEAEIVALLAEHFFVKVIQVPVYLARLGRRGLIHEVAGTRANVEMAVHVHGFLLATTARLWAAARDDDARIRDGRDRQAFQAGVVRGFRDKLADERRALRGVGLVWRGDRDLDDFYRARNPRVTTRRRRVRIGGAHAAGEEAGRKVVLHRPIEGGAGGGGRRLLGR